MPIEPVRWQQQPSVPPKPPGAARPRLGRRLAFSTIVPVALLAAVELGLRALLPSLPRLSGERAYEPDPVLGFRPRPGTRDRFFNGVAFTLNSLGFRGRDVAPAKADGTTRVLCLGDSFAFGKGVPDGATFPEVLEARLRERPESPTVDVINAGVNGYGTDQQALLLEQIGPSLVPEVVLVAFFVGNDFGDNLSSNELSAYRGYLVRTGTLERTKTLLGRAYLRAKTDLSELWLTKVVRSLSPQLRAFEPGSPYCVALVEKQENPLYCFRPAGSPHSLTADAVAASRRLLETIAERCRDLGAAAVLLVLPDRLQIEPELREIVLRRRGEREEDFDLARPQNELAAIARELGMAFVDGRAAFPDTRTGRYFLPCDTHFNVEGNAAVADYLARELCRLGVVP